MSSTARQATPGWYDDGAGRQRWFDGNVWTNHYADQQPQAVIAQPQYAPQQVIVNQRKNYKTSHGFHLVMSLITLGLWLPVWLIVGLYNAAKA